MSRHHHESREERREEREWERERDREYEDRERDREMSRELREEERHRMQYQQQFLASAPQQPAQQQAALPVRKAPRVVQGHYKHVHLFHHHGKLNFSVPAQFFLGQETEFKEPGGEEIMFKIPEDAQPGDDLIIEF